MKSLTINILDVINNKKSNFVSIKLIFFISYLIACIFAVLFIWRPYIRNLDIEVIRTKSMISIIPFDIIRQVSDIQKYILDNIIFAN